MGLLLLAHVPEFKVHLYLSEPDPGIKPASLASPPLAGGFFTTAAPGQVQRGINAP